MEHEKNPWDEDYVAPQAPPAPQVPTAPVDRDPWESDYSAPVGGDDLFGDLNQMRNEGEFEGTPSVPEQGVVQSKSEIYQPVNDQDKYKELSDYENTWDYTIGPNITTENAQTGKTQTYSIGKGLNPFGGSFLDFSMPPELQRMREERAKEQEAKYADTGQTDTMLGGVIPVRTQQKRENNPAFDPSKPEGPENPAMISTRYMVDPPTQDTITRMGYQVLQNIVGGIGDFVTEGKLTGEGAIGRSMPETVPNEMGEKFADDMATFVLGPMVVGKAVKGVGVAVGAAGKAAQTLSPEATQAIKVAYETTLKGTGSAIKAKAAANAVTRNMLVGLSFGVNTGKMGLTDAVISPNDSQGLINPEWIQREFNVSRERADDYSVMLDSPIIAGSLGTFGKMYTLIRDKVVSPAVGGVRNIEFAGLKGNKLLRMSEKNAGLALITRIDPNITTLAPEDAAMKIKFLGDAIQRNGVKNFQLANAGKEIKLDTPSAFTEVAQDYYRSAYANLRDVMGDKEFNEWIADQAHNSSRTLFEIRTAISSNEPNAKSATRLADLFDEGANDVAGGNLQQAQGKLGQMAEQRQMDRTVGADLMEDTARKDFEAAKEASNTGISNDPEFRLFMDEADTELGSKSAVGKAVHGQMSEKTYQALKKLKGDSDTAYKRIADSGAEGDPASFLDVAQKYDDPDVRRWAESINSDPSFGNMYNKVRTDIKKKIGNELASSRPNNDKIDMLRDLQNNLEETQLDFLKSNGDDDVVKMVDEARGSYKKLYDAFKSDQFVKPLYGPGKTRMSGEGVETATGIPRGKTDWDTTFGTRIQQLDGINGPHLRKALKKAAEVGGQDISGDLANYYATRAITNITNSVSAGSKQSVSQLRNDISGIIEGLQGVNSPMVPKLRAMEQRLQALENTTLGKQEAYETIKRQADDLRKEASQSILGRFIYKDGRSINPSEVGGELKKIFRGQRSVSDVNAILKEAQKAGMETEARQTLQGTYLDYLGERVRSRSPLGIGDAGPNGEVRTGFRISETQVEKIFDEGGNDLANLKTIFADKPEVIKTVDEIRNVYTNISKKTPKADGDVLGPIDRSEDPEQALQSIVTLYFGPLNRTGSKVRRLTTPLGIDSLAKVREKKANLFNAMMEDPDKFSEVSQQISKGFLDNTAKKWIVDRLGRAAARTINDNMSKKAFGSARGDDTGYFGTGDFKPALKTEMEKLNIQK